MHCANLILTCLKFTRVDHTTAICVQRIERVAYLRRCAGEKEEGVLSAIMARCYDWLPTRKETMRGILSKMRLRISRVPRGVILDQHLPFLR